MNKKELKQLVSKESSIVQIVVKKPYAFVQVAYKSYYGVGFSKWSTEDMSLVSKASKILKSGFDCPCDICLETAQICVRVIEKYDWSEERARDIAYGRAVMDIVEQIRKSKSGLSEVDVTIMSKLIEGEYETTNLVDNWS